MQKQELPRFVWFELHTPDAAASSWFYSKVFGWAADDVSSLGRPYLTLRSGNDAVAGILPKSIAAFEADKTHPRWMGYIQVSDVQIYVARVKQAGGQVRRAIQEIPGLGRFAVVGDPENAAFVIYQPLFQGSDVNLRDVGAIRFRWHDLICTNGSSQLKFYSSVFGWTKLGDSRTDASTKCQSFAIDGVPVGGMMHPRTSDQEHGWVFNVDVMDMKTAIGRAVEAGGALIHEPFEIADGRRVAQCVDAQGIAFGMVASS